MSSFRYKIFDLYTQQYFLTDPSNPEAILQEEVQNSLLEFILPEEAADKLSIATIEMGMSGEEVAQGHPDPENNVLLLAKGSRGIYGPSEYKQLLEPYMDLVADYPYQRYLTNENDSSHTKDLKIWVVDDEAGISGIDGVSSETASALLGDSHGKMSLKLAQEIGSPQNLMQYRMISADPSQGWFAKGTFAPSLQSTLKKFDLHKQPELADVDLIVPTSSLKGKFKSNLPPGIHQQKVHLTNHDRSASSKISMAAILEKLDGDAFTSVLKQQSQAITDLNQTLSSQDDFNQAFLKSLQPMTMPNPENPEERISFDEERWEECGDWKYIAFRKDLEAGHHQIINSPVYAQDREKFVASRARKAAELTFVKAKGGMILASSELKNNEICVPWLNDGDKVAAIRSPIIKLQDIALVENRLIDDIYNDAGKPMDGVIICSPQTYDQLIYQTRDFIQKQTEVLESAGIATDKLQSLNPWVANEELALISSSGAEREKLTEQLNNWRTAYNDLVFQNEVDAPELEQIRQDTFTAIIKGDFDGDNIAVLAQKDEPAIYAGIESRIASQDSYTVKLDKIKVAGDQQLSELMAAKSDPYILGKTSNLAEQLQSLAVAANRVSELGNENEQNEYLKNIAPVYHYLITDPTPQEVKAADAAKVESTYRFYAISSTGEKLIDPDLVREFDAYQLDRSLLQVEAGQDVTPLQRKQLFNHWEKLLLNLTDAIAQQNQIAVDTFKSERPIDNNLVEGLSNRFKLLNDGLKKQLDDNETYLSAIPETNNQATNRAILVENVNSNLVAYQGLSPDYKQLHGLFPTIDDETIQQEVATLSHNYDRLTSLSSSLREKSRIDNGPSLTFVDNDGRTFEITNIMAQKHTVSELREKVKAGQVNIQIESNKNKKSPHKMFAKISFGDGEFKPLGTVCNACVKKLQLETNKELSFVEVGNVDFISSASVHLADAYSAEAYRMADEFRSNIPEEMVDEYAAATFSHLTNTSAKANRLGLMFKIFGPELSQRLESRQINDFKLDRITGVDVDQEIKFTVKANPDNPFKNQVFEVKDDGELVELGSISASSSQLPPGTVGQTKAQYVRPSVADFVLPTGEELTVGGMSKKQFTEILFRGQELQMEVAPGEVTKTPVLMFDGKIIGNLKADSAAYLADNQLLNQGQKLDLTMTTVGEGRYQKLKAIASNGKVLEVIGLAKDFKAPMENQAMSVEVGFKTNRALDNLFVYHEGKRVAVGEFNYGSGKSHRNSLDKLKELGHYKKPFRAKITSRISNLSLEVVPESLDYQEVESEALDLPKIVNESKSPLTAKLLHLQSSNNTFGVIRERLFLDADGVETLTVPGLDIVVDRNLAEQFTTLQLEEIGVSEIADGNISIADEVERGFRVFSVPTSAIDAAQLTSLKETFGINEVFDLTFNQDQNQARYDELKARLPKVQEFEPDAVNNISLPLHVGDRNCFKVISPELLTIIQSGSQDFSNLNRFDLDYLKDRLAYSVDEPSDEQVLAEAFQGENLATLTKLTEGFITPEEAIVLQHRISGTDLRYEEDAVAIFGKDVYANMKSKADQLIEQNATPLVMDEKGNISLVEKFADKSKSLLQFPELIVKQVSPPILISAEDELGLALNNPLDESNPDRKHPIRFKGKDYLSVQEAATEIIEREKIPKKKSYHLIKALMEQKFVQHPQIWEQVQKRGGYKWLYNCSHEFSGSEFWSGTGKDSAYINLLAGAAKMALRLRNEPEKVAQEAIDSSKATRAKLDKLVTDTVEKYGRNTNSTLKVVVAGSRDFADYDLLKNHLDKLLAKHKEAGTSIEIVSGKARGADSLGEKYAQEHGYKVAEFPADWNTYGKSAGYRRNEQMAKYGDLAVVFWDGKSKGTKLMIDLCDKHNIPCDIANYQIAQVGSPFQNTAPKQIKARPILNAKSSVSPVSMVSIMDTQKHNSIINALQAISDPEFQSLRSEVQSLKSGADFSVFDTVKFWQKDGENVLNSLTVNFSDGLDSDGLRYQAAVLGQATNQKAVMTFRGDRKGNDYLHSFAIPNHVEPEEIKTKLGEQGINKFSLIPTEKFTKVVVSDPGGQLINQSIKFGENYGIKPKSTKGQAESIKSELYSSIISTYKSLHSRDESVIKATGNGVDGPARNQLGSVGSTTKRVDRTGAGAAGRSGNLSPADNTQRGRRIAAPTLKSQSKAVMPQIKSPAAKHQALALKAVPAMRSILRISESRVFEDAQVKVSYQPESKTLQCDCVVTGETMISLSHNGQEWQSDPNLLGSFTVRDLSYLEQVSKGLSQANSQSSSTVSQALAEASKVQPSKAAAALSGRDDGR